MLTTDDLQKIGELLDEKMDKKFKEELTPIKKDIRIIKADLRSTIKFFDDDITVLKKRVGRIEEYIGINK